MQAYVWVVAALAVAPLEAQFSGLVTRNGAALYFSSTLSLKGSGQPNQGRIYKVGSTPLQVVASVAAVGAENPCVGLVCVGSYFDLSQPDVSSDGTVLAYLGTAPCAGLCSHTDPHQTTVRGVPGKGDLVFGGRARLSGNGRYLVRYVDVSVENFTQFYRTDLSTGETSTLATVSEAGENHFPVTGRAVADNGDFVAFVAGELNIFRSGQFNPIPPPKDAPNFVDAAIDSAGDAVVYQVCCTLHDSFHPRDYSYVRVFHPGTGQDAVLLQGNGNVYEPMITADGRQVAFLTTAATVGATDTQGPTQVYMADVDGTAIRAVTNDADGAIDFALSGDGQTVWYLTETGALFRLNIASGDRQPEISPSCQVTLAGGIVPGSAMFLNGTCLGKGFTVTFDGIPGAFISRVYSEQDPVLLAPTGGMWIQVPWTVIAPKAVAVSVESDSPFELPNTTLNSVVSAPGFVSQLIHQDWSAFVNQNSPARANEAVSIYAVGLGPVQPPVVTGAPGPANPPSSPVTPFSCNVPVLFAGLAPDLVGFYQVTIQMPTSGPTLVQVSCTGGAGVLVAFQP